VARCFAHDNAARACVAGGLACGIFARVTGWLEALGLAYDIEPGLDACLIARGEACIHTVIFRKFASPA